MRSGARCDVDNVGAGSSRKRLQRWSVARRAQRVNAARARRPIDPAWGTGRCSTPEGSVAFHRDEYYSVRAAHPVARGRAHVLEHLDALDLVGIERS